MIRFIRETRILNPKPTEIFRQNSVDFSFQCVNYIYQISNNNRSNELNFNMQHTGSLNEDYIIIGILSYFLLNYPIKKIKQIKTLQRAQSVQEIVQGAEIIQKTLPRTIPRTISMEYEPEQKSLKFLSCKNFVLYTIFTDHNEVKYIIDKLNEMKDYIKEASCILIGVLPGKLEDKMHHVQCFFTCEKKLYFYDNQGIKIDDKVNYFISFDWKTYLIQVIDNNIKTITKLNKYEMYKNFSQFYYDLLKYPTTLPFLINNFVIIKNENYTKEVFKMSLLNNLKTNISHYNNKTIINHLKNNNMEVETLFELLNNLLINNDLFNDIYPAMEELIKKDNIDQCFTIKDYMGHTLLHNSISKYGLKTFNLFLSHPKIKNSFSIQSEGYTPLHYALRFDYLDKVKLLLQNPNIEECFTIPNNYGVTVLHIALLKDIEILKLFLSKPEIEKCFTIQDEDGNTPLHKALDQRLIENRNELLNHPKISISYDIKNKYGLTPRDIAKTNNIQLL